MKRNKKLLSKRILIQSIKGSWKLWTVLTAVLCFFMIIMTVVSSKMTASGSAPFSAVDFLAMSFFGAMALMIMIIYAVTTGNKLVASEVDRGQMSFTLNTPTTRRQLILSKALFYVGSLFAMAVAVGLSGIAACAISGAELAYGKYLLLVLGFFLFGFATSGVCFLASCWFNKTGNSIMVGAGFPVAFFLLNQLSSMKDFEWFKYFSLNTLFDTGAILAGGAAFIIHFVVLAVAGAALYTVGIFKFLKKDLPL